MKEQVTNHNDIIMYIIIAIDVIFTIAVIYYFFKTIRIEKTEDEQDKKQEKKQ